MRSEEEVEEESDERAVRAVSQNVIMISNDDPHRRCQTEEMHPEERRARNLSNESAAWMEGWLSESRPRDWHHQKELADRIKASLTGIVDISTLPLDRTDFYICKKQLEEHEDKADWTKAHSPVKTTCGHIFG